MFKSIHGTAPTYLSDRIVVIYYVNGYETRKLYNTPPPPPPPRNEACRNSFKYMGDKLWKNLPGFFLTSVCAVSFKRNYNMYKLIISSWQIWHFRTVFQIDSLCMMILCSLISE